MERGSYVYIHASVIYSLPFAGILACNFSCMFSSVYTINTHAGMQGGMQATSSKLLDLETRQTAYIKAYK
jgi:hypothetical protein